MSCFINTAAKNLPPSGIRRFFDLVLQAGPDVVSLGVGEPDFSAPWHIREATIFSLEKGFTSYTENAGLMELRQEISDYHKNITKYDPVKEILVTNGASEGMDLAFRATIEKGDKILVPNPGYVMYEPLITLSGGVCISYDPLDIKNILVANDTKAIVLNSPGNPIGNIISNDDLKYIADISEKNNLLIYSDEIYSGLCFTQKYKSIIEIDGMRERSILFNGLSKTHAMTGFRIAWACGPPEIIAAMTKIHQYSALCASSISQLASIEALRHGEKEFLKMKNIFDKRRKYCIDRLKKIGAEFCEPEGAFYLFVKIPQDDDILFCENLLQSQKLAVVPGSAFGTNGKGFVRMTYAASMDELKKALDRFEKFILQAP